MPASLGRDIGRQGNPNVCTDAYAPAIWLGKPGALTRLRMPAADYPIELNDHFAVHNLLDGQSVDRSPYAVRSWAFSHEWLRPEVATVLFEYATRQRGFGPFILIDPHEKNVLTPNQASGTDALHTTEGFSVVEESTYVVLDTFTRSVTGGWGSTDTGQAYTLSGTAADFNVNGTQGTIQPSALSADRLAYLTADRGVNRTVKVDTAFVTLPASGLLRSGVILRETDTSNYYTVQFQVTSGNSTSISIFKRIAGSQTLVATKSSPSSVVNGSVTAATFYTVKGEIEGTTIRARVWPTASTEPIVWDLETTDSSLGTGSLAGVIGRNETAVTTHVIRYDNFSSTSLEHEALSSSTTSFHQGERSLGWALPSTVTSGVLTLDAPTGLLGWSIPAATNWAFSGWLRLTGTDPLVSVTPRMVWKDITGAMSGAPVSGNSVNVNSTGWQSFCVTGSAPIDGLLTVQLIASSASVTGTATVLVDELQLEQGTSCTAWEYGRGQPLVAVRIDRQTVPRILRTSLNFIVVEVT